MLIQATSPVGELVAACLTSVRTRHPEGRSESQSERIRRQDALGCWSGGFWLWVLGQPVTFRRGPFGFLGSPLVLSSLALTLVHGSS